MASRVLDSICGHDEHDSTSLQAPPLTSHQSLTGDLSGLTVGIPQEYCVQELSDTALAAWETAITYLKAAGARIVPVQLPLTSVAISAYYIIATAEAASNLSRYDGVRYGPPMPPHRTFIDSVRAIRGDKFGAEVQRRILAGTFVLSAA